MADRESRNLPVGWTIAQRRAILFFLSIFLAALCWRYARNNAYVPTPQPPEGARAGELASRFDPNTADWQTLAAIPMLGEKKAHEIVSYREKVTAEHPNRIPFKNASDLTRIKGIGKATVENLKPYLSFPASMPAAAD